MDLKCHRNGSILQTKHHSQQVEGGALSVILTKLGFHNPIMINRISSQNRGGIIMAKESGVVKWFSRLKGYGFINPDDGSQEVFVHYSAINGDGYRNLYEGEQVEFELVDRGKGPQAQNVRPKHS